MPTPDALSRARHSSLLFNLNRNSNFRCKGGAEALSLKNSKWPCVRIDTAFFGFQAILKAGVNISGDALKVSRDFSVQVQGLAELMSHPVVQADTAQRSRSLASEQRASYDHPNFEQ